MVPAVLGQFVSHGTRTAAFEGTLMALAALGAGAGGARGVQWQARLAPLPSSWDLCAAVLRQARAHQALGLHAVMF